MNKCLKIVLQGALSKDTLPSRIQKHAKRLFIEGTVRCVPDGSVKIMACGNRENVDKFLDAIHKEIKRDTLENIEVEPFIKDTDYRGVFRFVE